MKLLVVAQVIDKNHPILGFFHRWVEEFAEYFDEVHVICLYRGFEELPNNVYTYSLGKEGGENKLKYIYKFYKYFIHIFFNVKVDYVFFHMGAIYNVMAAPFFLIRKLYQTRFYWWKAHGHINFIGRVSLFFVDQVVTSTASGFPIASDKRRIIGQAIDTSLFLTQSGGVLRVNDRVIFVGRIMPIKKIEIFIDVVEHLLKEGVQVDARIIGPIEDKEYFKYLNERIKSKNLTNVSFTGPCNQRELVDEYSRASVFLNTSLTHSMDKTVLEAMLCGCIPITANRAFMTMLGEYGLYFQNQNVREYALCIQRIIDGDKINIRKRLRAQVCEKHSIKTFSRRVFCLK